MSLAISVENVSKAYKIGEIDRSVLIADVRSWWRRLCGGADYAEEDHLYWALRDVSFDIKKGETVGVIGKNGAGKSTLLKLLSRITSPTRGKIRIDGRIGSLLEVGAGFNPALTGRENVHLNGAILGLTRAETSRMFDTIVEFAEIGEFIDTPVKRYSSGMHVRLAFSVAAFLEPEIIILDEILAVGDMAFRRKCMDRIERLIKHGHTIFFVAHDMGSVIRFCSRAIWLEKGRIKMDGPAEDVCELYRKEEMAATATVEGDKVDRRALVGDGVYEDLPEEGREGDGRMRIKAIRVLNADGRPCRGVPCGTPLGFALDYECEGPIPEGVDGFVALLVDDEQGRRLMRLRSDVVGVSLSRLNGRGTTTCWFARNPFMPGVYGIGYNVMIGEVIVDRRLVAAHFESLDGDFYGYGVRPTRSGPPICHDYVWENTPSQALANQS